MSHFLCQIVVLGCGWAGFRLCEDINKSKYDVTCVSPRNHFLFTPLLPSTAVGTLEFRCIQEPGYINLFFNCKTNYINCVCIVRTIPNLHYFQAHCNSIDFEKKTIACTDVFNGNVFQTEYDFLVLAPGSQTNTFGVPGVYDNPNVFFLKQLTDSRKIRNRLIDCFERASIPNMPDSERDALLTFMVVGENFYCLLNLYHMYSR